MHYFDHDVTASTDERIMSLRLQHGGAAVDAYWYLLEQLYKSEQPLCERNANAMRTQCYVLCTDFEQLDLWISAMLEVGLFVEDPGGNITSPRACEHIEAYHERQEKARSSAKSRWNKQTQCERNATAKRTHSERNANPMLIKTKTKIKNNKDDAKIALCPMDGTRLFRNTQTGRYECTSCMDSFDADKVRWG